MPSSKDHKDHEPENIKENGKIYLFFFLVATVLLLLMPSKKSLWVDEAIVGLIARQPDFATFCHHFWNFKMADWPQAEALKPLCSWNAWWWARFLGTGEWQLRFPNCLWLFSGLVCLWKLGLRWNLPYLTLAFALHPFVWYYVDEARPYAMQLAAGCWMLYFWVEALETKGSGTRWLWGMMAASLVMSAASMLGVLSASAAWLLLFATGVLQKWEIRKAWGAPFLCGIALHLLLGGYYLRVLMLMDDEAGSKMWNLGLSNILYCLYEVLGFNGLGPDRALLREMAKTSQDWGWSFLMQYGWVQLLLVAAYAGLAYSGLTRKPKASELHSVGILWGAFFLSLLFLSLGSWIAGWPFWGRHIAPTVPWLIAGWILLAGPQKKFGPLIQLSIWLLLLAVSSVNLRFNPTHAKDDNRHAVTIATTALEKGLKVWWVADIHSAEYYRLPATQTSSDPRKAFLVRGQSQEILEKADIPDVIIFCKPDIYDGSGYIRDYLKKHQYEPLGKATAFTYWKLPSSPQLLN